MIVCFVLAAGARINTDAAKRFIRSALWEAEQEAGEQQQPEQNKGPPEEGSSEKERRKDKQVDIGDSSGDGGIEEAGSSYSGGKKRKLGAEDAPSSESDSTKRTHLE